MDRRHFLQASGMLMGASFLNKLSAATVGIDDRYAETDGSFPLMDLHVHRSEELTIEDIVAKSEELNMKIGVMENIAPWGITNDEQLETYINAIKPYPVYIGLQPMSPGWSKNLSPDLIGRADYIAMDPQIVENGNGYGETIMLWEYTSYIDDPDAFMEQNMKHYLNILTGKEPLDIFACPLFLPVSIQREYHRLWTKKRLQQIIDAARERNIAIEINDTVRVPHEEFVLMAKKAGLKFTFGSDARNHTVGRLDYCKYIAGKCGLTEKDFFIPKRHQ